MAGGSLIARDHGKWGRGRVARVAGRRYLKAPRRLRYGLLG